MAARVFLDEFLIDVYDEEHSDDDDRIKVIGMVDNVLVVIYTERGEIRYAKGDGNDSIVGFNETSTLRISDANYSTAKSGNDIIVTVSEGQITLKGAAKLSTVNIIANDKSIATVDGMCYSSLQEAINALAQKNTARLLC